MNIDFETVLKEGIAAKRINLLRLPVSYPWPKPLKVKTGNPAEIVEEVLSLLGRLHQGRIAPDTYKKRLGSLLRRRAGTIKKKSLYPFFVQAVTALEMRLQEMPEPIRHCLVDDFALLYLLLMRKNQILAGVREGIGWKEIQPPEVTSSIFWMSVAYQMLPFLGIIGRADLDLVPERFVFVTDYPQIAVPEPARSVGDLLEEAYHRQHFTLPPVGVAVKFENAGDVAGTLIKQIRDYLVARVDTPYGQLLTYLSLDLADGFSFEVVLDEETWLLNLLAEVYRDLVVTTEEGKIRRRREVSAPRELPAVSEERAKPTLSFRLLPRRIRGQEAPLRVIYSGPRRPPKLHTVSGHPRNVTMTEEHYRELLRWQDETGLRVPWHVVLKEATWDDRVTPPFKLLEKCGRTYVRPHFSPVSDEVIASLPTFIKRRLQKEIDRRAERS